MQNIVAFIGKFSKKEELAWIEHINLGLLNSHVVPFRILSQDQKSRVEVAIVANPNPEDLKELTSLRWVQSLWAGVERLVNESANKDFEIVRMVDSNMANTMSEAVLAWTLYLHRDMPKYLQQQKEKNWHQQKLIETKDRKIGVLGLGNIGKTCAERLLLNGFNVAGWSRTPKLIKGVDCLDGPEGFKQLLSQSDILICLLPLTKMTLGLLNLETLKSLPKGASLINFSRGAIVVEKSMLQLLSCGHLKHAVLDVFEKEPLPITSPLWGNKSITILPHISAPTIIRTASKIVAKNIMGYFETGEIPKIVNCSKGY